MAVPALLIGGQAVLFLAVYHHLLGGMGSAMAPHLLLAGLGTATLYRLAQTGRQLPWRVARALWLWGLALGTVGATTIFYLTATYCLVWLRDLPTRRMVVGHASQVPALLAALPVDRLTLVLAVGVVSGGVLMLTATVVWGLAGTRRDATPHRCTGGIQPTWWQVGGRLLPGLLLAGLVVMPPHGLLELREPWLRSLHDQPLSVARLGRQDNPVEVARDQRAAASYPTTPAGRRLHVVLIYVDGLRADVLQPYGGDVPNMPFLSGLVAHGTLRQYPRVFSSCSMTLCSLGTLLQSRPAHRISPGNFSFPDVLRRQGYQTRYLLSGDHRHFGTLSAYYDPSPDFYRDGADLASKGANDDLVVFRALPQLPSAHAATAPQFFMFGLMSAHVAGRRSESFRRWRPDKLSVRRFTDLEANSVQVYRNNYHNDVLQADHVLATIWRWLDDAGYLGTSIVVITSDHGEALGERGRLGHARSLHTPELLIPLWIHDPTGRLQPRDPVFQQDIAPTVLDLLELPVPASWTGVSLLQTPPAERWHPVYFINSGREFGLLRWRDGRMSKYLATPRTGNEQVYDLDADLFEQHDLSTTIAAPELREFRTMLRATFGTLLPSP